VVDNPYTGEIHCKLPYLSSDQITSVVDKSAAAQKNYYRESTLDHRIDLCRRFMHEIKAHSESIAIDITKQMGKPLKQAHGEVNGLIERATAMIELAPQALADEVLPKAGFYRKLAREPVGVVLCIAPWNYPLLTAVNCVVPAILAGNSVLLKHSKVTPLCADVFEQAFLTARAPKGLVTALHSSHEGVSQVLARKEVGYVHFTGSVAGGHQVYETASKRFIDAGLELGGKDPAYVAADADLDFSVENVIDGAFYNAGQSCCGIERVYIHRSLYKDFVAKAIEALKGYQLGDPMDAKTNMGPMAQASSLDFLEGQVKDAVKRGAKLVAGGKRTTDAAGKGRFFEPTLVINCDHTMSLMVEESFGPVLAVRAVDSDEEAVRLMNDSPYGLTASIWTKDIERAHRLAPQIETGTVFLNRCDYLDPYLAWTGVKDTGKGISLSRHGYNALTRVKSYHFRAA
jgi:acyl-CoA reductase-like NAD-dependent aldehyde dehydrogenase